MKVEYGEVLKEAEFRGTFKTVGDLEHSEMIRMYIEENSGMKDIAEKLHRSSRTPLEHIHKHNNAVKRSGFCAACKRAGSPYFNETAIRREL